MLVTVAVGGLGQDRVGQSHANRLDEVLSWWGSARKGEAGKTFATWEPPAMMRISGLVGCGLDARTGSGSGGCVVLVLVLATKKIETATEW